MVRVTHSPRYKRERRILEKPSLHKAEAQTPILRESFLVFLRRLMLCFSWGSGRPLCSYKAFVDLICLPLPSYLCFICVWGQGESFCLVFLSSVACPRRATCFSAAWVQMLKVTATSPRGVSMSDPWLGRLELPPGSFPDRSAGFSELQKLLRDCVCLWTPSRLFLPRSQL